MKWRVPNKGDERTVRRFAWLPMQIGKECRWLEWAFVLETWDDDGLGTRWIATRFLDPTPERAE